MAIWSGINRKHDLSSVIHQQNILLPLVYVCNMFSDGSLNSFGGNSQKTQKVTLFLQQQWISSLRLYAGLNAISLQT